MYKHQWIVFYHNQGYKPPTTECLLCVEGLAASRRGISKFIAKYWETGLIGRRTGSGRSSKITAEVKEIMEEQMQTYDETSANQLHRLLKSRRYNISLSMILRCRIALGLTFHSSSYYQLIRHANKQKRLDWAKRHTDLVLNDVVWTDEYTVQLESHCRFWCRKPGQPAKNMPRYTECMAVVSSILQSNNICTSKVGWGNLEHTSIHLISQSSILNATIHADVKLQCQVLSGLATQRTKDG